MPAMPWGGAGEGGPGRPVAFVSRGCIGNTAGSDSILRQEGMDAHDHTIAPAAAPTAIGTAPSDRLCGRVRGLCAAARQAGGRC